MIEQIGTLPAVRSTGVVIVVFVLAIGLYVGYGYLEQLFAGRVLNALRKS